MLIHANSNKAEFEQPCTICCVCGDPPRTYFYVLEHGITQNNPLACWFIPPNVCCPGADMIYQTYFDRGIFDQQHCLWKLGWLRGEPAFHANQIKAVCCCVEYACTRKCMTCGVSFLFFMCFLLIFLLYYF